MDRRADAAGFSGVRARSGVRQEVLLDVVAVGLEQHAGAAELTNLLLGPLIMPWRLPRWACITLPVAVTLKRFLAPDLVFSLGIWLSCRPQKNAPEGRFCGLKCSLER